MNTYAILSGGTLGRTTVKVGERIERAGVSEDGNPDTVKLMGPGRVYVYVNGVEGANSVTLTFDSPEAALQFIDEIGIQIRKQANQIRMAAAHPSNKEYQRRP